MDRKCWPGSGLALRLGFGLHAAGLVKSPLLIGIALSATSLGIVIPVLKDAVQVCTPFGQLVVAGASIAEIATIVLLSLFFSGEASGVDAKLFLLGLFGMFVLAVGVAVLGAEQSMRISATVLRLQDTTAEIRIRAAFLLLAVFVVLLAERVGLETILGAFLAGAILKLVDHDQMLTHPQVRQKLEAIGYGVFVPVFFVATGVGFELNALFANATTLARVPIFSRGLAPCTGTASAWPQIAHHPHAGARGSAVTGDLAQFPGRRRTDRCTAGSDPSRVFAALVAAGLYRYCSSRLRRSHSSEAQNQSEKISSSPPADLASEGVTTGEK